MAPILANFSRLQLFWDSPIPAGLFLAMFWSAGLLLTPLLADRPWIQRIACLSWDIVLPLGLALTQSRGPALAFAASCAAGSLAARHLCPELVLSLGGRLATALLTLLLGTCLISGADRYAAALTARDDSVVNRWRIWSHAGELLSQEPWTGLGPGESGYFYSQWYQEAETSYLYRGLFNDYLGVGVELGVPFLVAAIAAAFSMGFSFLAVKPRVAADSISPVIWIAAYLSTLTFLLGAATSSFAHYPSILLLASLASLSLVLHAIFCGKLKRLAIVAMSCAAGSGVFVAVILLIVGPSRRTEFTVALQPDRSVLLKRSHTAMDMIQINVLVDPAVTGTLYGQFLRAVLQENPKIGQIRVFDPRFSPSSDLANTADLTLLLGEASRLAPNRPVGAKSRIVVIHPAGAPPAAAPASVDEIWLPEHDETGWARSWEVYSLTHDIPVRRTPSLGQRLEPARLRL